MRIRSMCPLDDDGGKPSPEFTVRGFEAYKNYLEDGKSINVDPIMEKLGSLIKDKAKISSLEVVGHAAEYGNADFEQNALSRAQAVEGEIRSAMISLVPDFDETLLPFNTYGVAELCPIDENTSTQGRRNNRRVEVWINYEPAPKPAEGPSLKKMLNYAINNTEDPTIKCIARKLKKKGNSHNYLSRHTVEAAYEEKLSGKTLYNFIDYQLNMRDLAIERRKKILQNPLKGKSAEKRFLIWLRNTKKDLMKAISIDLTITNCDDPRTHKMRQHVIDMSKFKRSFYSCKEIIKSIGVMLDNNNGSVTGCGKGY